MMLCHIGMRLHFLLTSEATQVPSMQIRLEQGSLRAKQLSYGNLRSMEKRSPHWQLKLDVPSRGMHLFSAPQAS